MHELSIAMSIVEMAQEEAGSTGSGPSAGLYNSAPRPFIRRRETGPAFVLRNGMSCDTLWKDSQFVIEGVPVEVYCPRCRASSAPLPRFSGSAVPNVLRATPDGGARQRTRSGRTGDQMNDSEPRID